MKILKLTFLAISIPILVMAILIAIYIAAAFTTQFYTRLNPGPAQEKIELFMKSDKQEIRLAELFPWEWEFMCTTGDYASRRAFETALGRKATVGDYLTWYWHGRWFMGVEGVDNLIFEKGGEVDIYQLNVFARPYIYLPQSVRSRGACVRYSKTILAVKDVGQYSHVDSVVKDAGKYVGKSGVVNRLIVIEPK